MQLTRRDALKWSVSAAALAPLALMAMPAAATPEAAAEAVSAFAGTEKPAEGRVTLITPEIAENGNTVPVEVSVDSPMTEDDYVAEVMIVAEGNPNPGVATFKFTPMAGAAEASTRIRLAKTQNVIAVARMSDGSVHMDSKQVKVTIGGCGG